MKSNGIQMISTDNTAPSPFYPHPNSWCFSKQLKNGRPDETALYIHPVFLILFNHLNVQLPFPFHCRESRPAAWQAPSDHDCKRMRQSGLKELGRLTQENYFSLAFVDGLRGHRQPSAVAAHEVLQCGKFTFRINSTSRPVSF